MHPKGKYLLKKSRAFTFPSRPRRLWPSTVFYIGEKRVVLERGSPSLVGRRIGLGCHSPNPLSANPLSARIRGFESHPPRHSHQSHGPSICSGFGSVFPEPFRVSISFFESSALSLRKTVQETWLLHVFRRHQRSSGMIFLAV